MLRVGLTGGIGSGKSTVSARLVSDGALLVDSDVLAREVVARGTDGLARVVATFGSGVLDDSGDLDRGRLASVVFADPEARGRLEAIVHPLVRAAAEARFASAPADAVVVNDVPLLAETGIAPTFDLVIVVTAAEAVRVERLIARGMSVADAKARIAAQSPDRVRNAVADALVVNDGHIDHLHRAVDSLWRDRLLPFEDNKRHRRAVEAPDRPHPVEYRARWAEDYARLAARLRHIVGDVPVVIDHIGSTAVPGMPGEDVVDAQIALVDPADAESVGEALAREGYPPLDPPTDSTGRRHGGADPGAVRRIHVRRADDPVARRAVLVRDWLRASPDGRSRYSTFGRPLAVADEHAPDGDPYASGLVRDAEAWANTVGWRPDF